MSAYKKNDNSSSGTVVPMTHQDGVPTLTGDSDTSWALWRLYLILKEIAESSQRKDTEATSKNEK